MTEPATPSAPSGYDPRTLRLYVGAVGVCGLLAVGLSAWQLARAPHPAEWIAFAALAMAAGRFAMKVPGVDARLSVSDVFSIASVVLFGPAPATVAIAIDSLGIAWRRGWDRQQQLFNTASPALSLWSGAQVFFILSRSGPLYDSTTSAAQIVLPLAGFASVYFFLNSGLTAIAVALAKGTSPVAVWRRHFGVVSLNYFASGSAAFVVFMIVQFVGLVAIVAVVPLFAIIYLAMQSWAGRLEDAEQHVSALDRLYLSTIGALSTAIEAKDGVTSSHIHRVQHYAMGLARTLDCMDALSLKALQAAALLHDTGKLAVPERILNKPGKLTTAEFETMKQHVNVGADILSAIEFPYPVVPIVRAHHENWDGTGYPNGLRGEEIPIGARILSIVDCYDALTSDRPYRSAMTESEALDIIRARRGTMYQPLLVDVFERVCRDIAPISVAPALLQKAVQQINKAVAPAAPFVPPRAAARATTPVEEPESLRALVNLTRIVAGQPRSADVASMAWVHIKHMAPGASWAFFLSDTASDSVTAQFVAGEASSVLQGLAMKVGDRLTGWVAENQQPIVNSEANLDLGQEAALANLRYCLAVPMTSESQVVGVLTLYQAEAFGEEQARALQLVAPHLAQMFLALASRSDAGDLRLSRSGLRVVASR